MAIPRQARILSAAGAACVATLLSGCSRGPARVGQPAINPATAAAEALAAYDTNRDGRIAGTELDASPALKSALARLDANGDGGVSAEEIAERISRRGQDPGDRSPPSQTTCSTLGPRSS